MVGILIFWGLGCRFCGCGEVGWLILGVWGIEDKVMGVSILLVVVRGCGVLIMWLMDLDVVLIF